MTTGAEILTPLQAARYLQVSTGAVYRYIRDGRLLAARLGNRYRIRRQDIDLLLLASSARPDIHPRDYTDEEIDAFMRVDELTPEQQSIARAFLNATSSSSSSEN